MELSIRPERGCPFGSHRANGQLPQPAERVDAGLPIYANELLVAVDMLNLDSSSMRQISESKGGDRQGIVDTILGIVHDRGKMHNPVTGSGGVLIGRVAAIGPDYPNRSLRVGDRICTMVSLSLTPLALDGVSDVNPATAQVRASGYAILFESGLHAAVPEDIPLEVSLALFDVAGAPGTLLKTVKPGMTVCVLGTGKAGTLCLFAARECLKKTGRLIAVDASPEAVKSIRALGIADNVLQLDLRDPVRCSEKICDAMGGRLADLTINTTNVSDTEGASILVTQQGGRVFFFSMATSFTRAALTAEGVGRDIEMLIGNGYTDGWVDTTLGLYRSHPNLRVFMSQLLMPTA